MKQQIKPDNLWYRRTDRKTQRTASASNGEIWTHKSKLSTPREEWWINKQKNVSAAPKQAINRHTNKRFRKKVESKEKKREQNTIKKSVSWSRLQQIGNGTKQKPKLFQPGLSVHIRHEWINTEEALKLEDAAPDLEEDDIDSSVESDSSNENNK